MTERPWRIGSKYKVHVYEETPDGDIPVATAMTEEYAEQIVRDHNKKSGTSNTDNALQRLYKAVMGYCTVDMVRQAEAHPDNAAENEMVEAICEAEEALGIA